MQIEAVQQRIRETIIRLLSDRGLTIPDIAGNSSFLSGEMGIDSVDLAAVVVELQEFTGKDPFEDGFINFRTVDELARLFAEAA